MANDQNTQALIRRILDSGDLLPETVDELQEYLEEIDRKGSLDRMDMDYVQGLARRLGIGGKGKGSGAGGGAATGGGAARPAAANDSGAGAPIARARELVGMLYDSDTGLNPEVSDERASEIMDELLQALDDVESAVSRR